MTLESGSPRSWRGANRDTLDYLLATTELLGLVVAVVATVRAPKGPLLDQLPFYWVLFVATVLFLRGLTLERRFRSESAVHRQELISLGAGHARQLQHNADAHTEAMLTLSDAHREELLRELEGYRRQAQLRYAIAPLERALRSLRAFEESIEASEAGPGALALLNQIVRHISEVFGAATGQRCRVCIKGVYRDPAIPTGPRPSDGLVVRTLARAPEVEIESQGADLLAQNSDFKSIVDEEAPYFISNDLLRMWRDGLYANSHWTTDTIHYRDYTSALVFPIRCLLPEDSRASRSYDCVAFLAIDALPTDVFSEAEDVELGKFLASLLYDPLIAYQKIRQSKSGSPAGTIAAPETPDLSSALRTEDDAQH